jgi:thimet oligopeptidase
VAAATASIVGQLHPDAAMRAAAEPLVQAVSAFAVDLSLAVFDDNHMPASFTHLSNGDYSSAYYTDMWSLVIAKDLFTAFDQATLLDAGRARAYREAILDPGGSKPASDLVESDLKRPSIATAWEWRVNGE